MKPSFNSLKIIAGVLGLCGAVLGLYFSAERTKTQAEYMAFLHSLQATNITKIVIYDETDDDIGSVLSSVSSPDAIDAFARAANTVEPYWPNHPGYAKQYIIELYLTNGQKREFEFSIMGGRPDHTIYVAFVRMKWGGIFFYGDCKSAAFFDWMKAQTPNQSVDSK
jgi:hypothetical protein